MSAILTGNSWARLREIVRGRDNETCGYCGAIAKDGDLDHILPLSKNGHDGLDNLIWCCKKCNSEKGDLTLRQWVSKLLSNSESIIVRSIYPPAKIINRSELTNGELHCAYCCVKHGIDNCQECINEKDGAIVL